MLARLEARRLDNDEIKPFVDLSVFEHEFIRSSQGDVYFWKAWSRVIRSRVFGKYMWNGQLPFEWQREKVIR